MSAVLVTGGTGRLGTHAVHLLRARDHEVRVLSRRTGGDLRRNLGVREAAAGAELVLHAASDTHRRFGAGDPQQTRNLLAACANVRHLLYVSIVGVDQIPLRYYENKLECEQLVCESGLPCTVLRATQFHELIDQLFTTLARWPLAPLPPRAKVQPVAAEEVARRCVDLMEAEPLGRAPDFGGPEIHTVRELLDLWPGRLRVLPLPIVGRLLHAYAEGRNTTPEHADGRLTWAQYRLATSDRFEAAVRQIPSLRRAAYERVEDTVELVRQLHREGIAASIDFFGEQVADHEAAQAAVSDCRTAQAARRPLRFRRQ